MSNGIRAPVVVAAALFAWQASGAVVLVGADPRSPRMNSSAAWGNGVYVNLNIGDSLPYLGNSVTLLGVMNNIVTVSVDGETRKLTLARLALPTVINGLRNLTFKRAP